MTHNPRRLMWCVQVTLRLPIRPVSALVSDGYNVGASSFCSTFLSFLFFLKLVFKSAAKEVEDLKLCSETGFYSKGVI